jgi:hypothetical protein
VFCIEAGRPVYYFRFHDQTLEAPDYLVTDLILGRREHPYLAIVDFELICPFAGIFSEIANSLVSSGDDP